MKNIYTVHAHIRRKESPESILPHPTNLDIIEATGFADAIRRARDIADRQGYEWHGTDRVEVFCGDNHDEDK